MNFCFLDCKIAWFKMNKGAYLRLTTLFPFQNLPFLIYLKLAEVLTVKACWVKFFTMRVSCGLLMVSLNVLICGLVVNERIKKKQTPTYIHSFFTGICSCLLLFLFTWALSSWTTVLKAIRPDFSPRWHPSFSLLSCLPLSPCVKSCTLTLLLPSSVTQVIFHMHLYIN